MRCATACRLAKWVNAVACVIVAIAWLGSYRIELGYGARGGTAGMVVGNGQLEFGWDWHLTDKWMPAGLWYNTAPDSFWIYERRLLPTYVPLSQTCFALTVPFWFVLALSTVVTLTLWWRDRHRPAPSACRACGYDLTGNITGVCPECGAPILPAE